MGELGYRPGHSAEVFVGRGNRIFVEPESTSPHAIGDFLHVYVERLCLSDTAQPPIREPTEAYEHIRFLEYSDRERFFALYLNAKNRLNGIEEISRGTLTASIIHPREVYKGAIVTNSASILVAHNHPSGDPTPSREDIELTERLSTAGNILGIDLIDHMIVGAGRYRSMREEGFL